MIAITFALPAESFELLEQLQQRNDQAVDQLRIIRGRLRDRDVAILHTGVGQKHCAPRIDQFLAAIRPKLLISSGFAGSLTDRLNVGDLIIAENFSAANLSARLMEGRSPAMWHRLPADDPTTVAEPAILRSSDSQEPAPPSAWRIRSVRLLTLDSMLDSPEKRTNLANQTGADAIDMETETIAHICAAHGVPMISLRVISDSPAAPFPAPPDVLFDVVRQKTNFGHLVPYLFTHPTAMIRLLRFAGQISRARGKLTDGLIEFLTILAESSPI